MGEKPREILSLGEYQRLMDRFEKSDGTTLPDIYLAVRIDAHRTGDEWDDFPDEGYPFAPEFVSALTSAAQDLMCSGFRVLYSYIHGDEITLLLDPGETNNQRRRGRIASLVASYGAVAFLRASHRPVAFHAQLSELPTAGHVIDYFMWQRKVASRNYFSRTLGLAFAARGLTPQEIEKRIGNLTTEEQRFAITDELEIDRSAITPYHRFGLALWWERTGNASGFRLAVCDELPETDEGYRDLLAERIEGDCVLPDVPITQIPRSRVKLAARPEGLKFDEIERVPSRPTRPKQSAAAPPSARADEPFRISGGRSFRMPR